MAAVGRGRVTAKIMDQLASDMARLMESHAEYKLKLTMPGPKTPQDFANEALMRGQINSFLYIADKIGMKEELQSKARKIMKSRTVMTAQC